MRPDMDTPAGLPARLAGYEVVGILGEGGSGTVYEARAEGRAVALKVLREDQAPTGKERQRWVKEAEHLARIRHPGVVQVFGMGELDDGRPYLAMEHLHGSSLAEQLAYGPLPLERALLLFDQLAAAVEAIHVAGLIHRDLKPENVMLVDNGARAVLLDLGIARPAAAPPSTTTQAGYQRGTPAVMAPERFFGERATVQSDIYELAVVLFVMLTGGLPWREVLDAKQRLNPLTPSQVGVTLPPGTETAIMRALSTEAGHRPATVREFATEVRAAGWSGATAPANQPTPPPPAQATTTQEVRPSRLLPAVLLAAGLLLVGGGIAYALLMGGSSTEVAAAPAQAPAPTIEPVAAPIEPNMAELYVKSKAIVEEQLRSMPAPPTVDSRPDEELAVADQVAKPAPKKSAPKKSAPKKPVATPAAKASKLPPTPTGATPLTWCRKQFALYCTAEFKATEGSMAGALCKNMGEQVVKWEALPPAATASIEASCKTNYDNAAKAVTARLEMHKMLIEGGGAPPP